ncbi:hypothetical protein PPTG_12967 [Phytophthora nicotianae INRA-310]|uniref:RxLR effector protein n=1 Tax=Phytophthora nicotianae (strain INRA-310) TaxID=761204 RepID=W2Q5S6_PHYN3|nr:hypothetical protein PPTG_12967 [Phytophthora nicotianae INRA-310]ETN07625.1 hypothetical protein PPTG_12967 [Phytophthora nicotianae INRA-310]
MKFYLVALLVFAMVFRGISANIPGLEKISKAFTSSKTKELQGLLKADDSLGNAFKTLKLSKMPIGKDGFIETEMVVKFLSSRNFKVWSQHAAKLNKEDSYGAMITALTNVFGDKNVAIMVLLGKHSRSSSGVSKKLETALFNKWYTVDKYRTADDMFAKVLKANRDTIHGYAREKFIWGDYSKYITNRVMNY